MMKDYSFEYTDQKIVLINFILSFGLILLGLVVIRYMFDSISLWEVFGLIGISILFLLLNKKKFKKYGTAKLYNDSVEIDLMGSKQKIDFININYYYFYKDRHNSTTFTLELNDKTKFKIVCHAYYCKTQAFDDFFSDFKNDIELFNKSNNCNIPQMKTIMEKKSASYILFSITIVFLTLLFIIPFPPKILIISLTIGLIAPWIKYINSRMKK